MAAAFNGRSYIKEQMDSILDQSQGGILLVVSDDCSTDGTAELLDAYGKEHEAQVIVLHRRIGSGGAAAHFLGMLKLMADLAAGRGAEAWEGIYSLGAEIMRLREAANGAYFMLSDQDDVWLPQKAGTLLGKMRELELGRGAGGSGVDADAAGDRHIAPGLHVDWHTAPGLHADRHTVPGLTANLHTVPGLTADSHTVPSLTANLHTVPSLSANPHTAPGLPTDRPLAPGRPGSGVPILVHSDMKVVDENLKEIAPSFFKYQKISPERTRLSQLLVQNNVTGGAVMVNRAMLPYLERTPRGCLMHDAWLALLACCFGQIAWVDDPLYLYRQHRGNVLGAKRGGSLKEMEKRLEDGEPARRNYQLMFAQARSMLDLFYKELSNGQRETLNAFAGLPEKSRLEKMVLILRYGFTKNTVLGTLGQMMFMGD